MSKVKDTTSLVLLVSLLYFMWVLIRRESDGGTISKFVPFNATQAPDTLRPNQWKSIRERFGSLIQTVNGRTFAISYQIEDMLSALRAVLNAVAPGKYAILSVGEHQHFALRDVLIQEVETLAMIRFSSIDFVLESMNPFIIQKVVLTLDSSFDNTQDVQPVQSGRDQEFFTLRNPLHLFYPYNTSDNTMVITPTDVQLATDKIAYIAAERH